MATPVVQLAFVIGPVFAAVFLTVLEAFFKVCATAFEPARDAVFAILLKMRLKARFQFAMALRFGMACVSAIGRWRPV